jgi:hypothetical protein
MAAADGTEEASQTCTVITTLLDHRAAPAGFLGRSHPGPGQILASGRLARHASTGAPSHCCLPAR